jgi:SnoaL-like protein
MTSSAPAATAAVAQELVDLCRAGRNLEAVDRLYSKSIVSVEAVGNEQMPAEISGIVAVRAKNEWWASNNEVHSSEVNGPFLGEGRFAVQHIYDFTPKGSGQRKRMTEMALYTVSDGKIVREQFFYHWPGA